MYKTIIVEDDLMVCSILEKQLGKFAQLRLEGNYRRCADALEYTRQCITAALNKDVPRECMAALYRRVEGPLGDEILNLTPRAITERGSWIAGRTQADLERLTGRTKK